MSHRVMQLISSGGFYGAERVVIELSSHLAAQGWKSHVVVMDSPGADQLLQHAREANLPHIRLSGSKLNFRRVLRQIAQYARIHEIELAHAHGYKTDFALAFAPLPSGVRRVATCHSWYSDSLKLKLYEFADKIALRRLDYVVTVADTILTEVRRAGVRPENSRLITNGIAVPPDPKRTSEDLRAELGVPADAPLILRVGRLDVNKGNHLLLRALAKEPIDARTRLVLVGEGPEKGATAKLARELKLNGRVVFAGYRDDVHELMRAADLMVISSLKEGLPIVLLEAMAAGLPVVSTNAGMIPTVLRDGLNGWLVRPGDAMALRQALADALAQPEKRRRRAEQAREDFMRLYSREAMGRQYLDLYQQLLKC
jgi:glycosyltransferase involved in cell wall biosynthesis